MRRTILLSLFALLALSAASDACAQHGAGRGSGRGSGFARGGYVFSRGRYFSPYGLGYAYQPYDSGDAYDYAGQPADYPSQPVYFAQQPVLFVQPPATPAVQAPWHPVVTEYKWPAPAAAPSRSAPSATAESEAQTLAIVLKNGSTLSAVSIFATDDGLHYVDPDARHLHISMSEVDRAATLKLNHARKLDLYLPAAQ
jgi:hypothetical protein